MFVKYFSYAITDQSWCILCSGPLISFTCIYFLYPCLWFFICSKWPIFNCDLTWLYRRYEWVTRNLYTSTEHDTQTWTRKKCIQQTATILKSVKEKYIEFKIVQWKSCTKQIKLCCNPLMQMFVISSLACNVKECYVLQYNVINTALDWLANPCLFIKREPPWWKGRFLYIQNKHTCPLSIMSDLMWNIFFPYYITF